MSEGPFVRGKTSIVIPCYNSGKTLPETIASLDRVPSDAVCEIVVIDDGSTDPETLRVLDGLDPDRYRLVRTPNQGLGAARNTGIRVSHGEFIIPLDSDNLLRASYLVAGQKVLAGDPKVGVVYGDAQFFGERTGPWHVADFDLVSLVNSNFIDACALFRKTLWQDLGGYDEDMPVMGWEDWDFWIRAALRGWRFHHLGETAFDYRVRTGSMIGDTARHQEVLEQYIFNKPANQAARVIRDQCRELRDQGRELQQLRYIAASRSYRVGRAVLAPVRGLRRILRGTPRS